MATLCLVMVCVATGKMKKKGVSTANEGAIGIREGRTLDFSKGAFGDVPNDGILPELCSGEQRRIVAHLEEPSEISSSSSSVVSCAGCVEKSLLWSWPMQVGLRMRLGSHPLDYINCGPQVHGSRSRAFEERKGLACSMPWVNGHVPSRCSFVFEFQILSPGSSCYDITIQPRSDTT